MKTRPVSIPALPAARDERRFSGLLDLALVPPAPAQPQADVLSAFGVHLLQLPVDQALGYVRRHPGTLAYLGSVLIAGGSPIVSQAATLLAA